MDQEGNIYDLNGNFVATMGNDEEEEEEQTEGQMYSNY